MKELWLLIALLLFLAAIWKPLRTRALPALDARAAKIRAELEEAERLHEEAKVLLAQQQQQLEEGERLAREIVERAEAERRRLEQQTRAQLEALVARRSQQAEERIAQEEARAVAELRRRAAELAAAATGQVLRSRIDAAKGKRILEQAVEEVVQKLH